jgi:uncharacterized protein (DUF1684 family)
MSTSMAGASTGPVGAGPVDAAPSDAAPSDAAPSDAAPSDAAPSNDARAREATVQDALDLLDWRRRVGDLYRLTAEDALQRFRDGRDKLFREHSQSPIPARSRAAWTGLRWFEPDPAWVVRTRVEPWPDQDDRLDIDTGGEDGVVSYRRLGFVRFQALGTDCRLTIFAMRGYGGGLFLPFRDSTAGAETYGGGRYLVDTVKNTDGLSLVVSPGWDEVVLDFNYAYNPSCAYDVRWACPLAPPENRLSVPVRAGEMVPR